MKTLILFLFLSITSFAQIPNTLVPMAAVKTVTGPDCYFSNAEVSAYITGGVPPYQYKWSRKINGVTTLLQDYMNAPLVYDMLFPQFDRYGVDLLTEQPPMGPTSQLFTLTVLDSRVESTNPLNPDLHDTLIVSFNIPWPLQISYPNITDVLPSCDTCSDGYLGITPQNGTEPYDILLIGTDDFGNSVEYYGYHCQGLYITNLAQLHTGCYSIYIEDDNGCSESFDYCYTTTGIDELQLNKELVKVVDLMGRPSEPTPNKILIYYYSDGTIIKQLKSE